MDPSEVVQAAAMPWYGWIAILAVVGGIAYRISSTRKSGTGFFGGARKDSGIKKHRH